MSDALREAIRVLPDEAFRELESRFASLSPLERIRWLQQTAYFVWKYKGAARRSSAAETGANPRPRSTD